MLNPVMVQIRPCATGQSDTTTGDRPTSVATWALGRCFGLCQSQPHAKEAAHAAVIQCR
jgi:hypothetical protein